uniref:DDE Tnp4 domain-containing protein n=1 Tax=Heterorhabditis bacteriophora TaxID=37862 RepID=A0A1I7W784_HETBA
MEPQRVQIGMLLIGQRALALNLRSLSTTSDEVKLTSMREVGRCKSKILKELKVLYRKTCKVKVLLKIIIMTVHVLNSAFIADPKNPRRVHYCQPKSAARALIYKNVITVYNNFRRKTTGLCKLDLLNDSQISSYTLFYL